MRRISIGLYEYTHPGLVSRLGEDKALTSLRRSWLLMDGTELPHEELKFANIPTCLTAGERQFAIVPMLTTVLVRGRGCVQSFYYQVGILDVGAESWKYIEATSWKYVRELFPEFPDDFRFPPLVR